MRVGSGFRHSNQKARLGVQSAACRPTPELVFRVSFLVLARAQVGKVIAAVALAGCANSEAAKRAAAQAAFQAEIKAADAECQSYGAKPDSDAYVQCRLAIDVRKANLEAAAQAAPQQARTRP